VALTGGDGLGSLAVEAIDDFFSGGIDARMRFDFTPRLTDPGAAPIEIDAAFSALFRDASHCEALSDVFSGN
jgi:hypothetical protein